MGRDHDLLNVHLRLGGPGKDEGRFIGLALDARVSLLGTVVGGAIAVAIVWITARAVLPKQREAVAQRSPELLTKVAQNS